MTTIRVPRRLLSRLAPALRARGLEVVVGARARIALARRRPEDGSVWLALVANATAAAAALDEGADDAVTADEDPVLLAARAARLVRPRRLTVGPLQIDPVQRRAWRGERALDLLPREFLVLHYLAQHADRAVDRQELRRAVWGRDFDPGTNVIEVHVSRLRAQLDRAGPPMLCTDRGLGYRLASRPGAMVAGMRHAS